MALHWFGDNVKRTTLGKAANILSEFGLRAETSAKQELQPGHGVISGTLRRSIHTAAPGYSWAGDNIFARSAGAPERGGQEVEPQVRGNKLTLELGSGMEYAMAVHQGHGSFEGYHYLRNGVDKTIPKMQDIIKRHKL